MFEDSNMLDLAIEEALEKSTSNARAHISAAQMSQEDHDKHVDALAHHAGAIEYYRNKPEVKSVLEKISKEVVPLREFVNKPIKLETSSLPQITADDLNKEHPKLQGRADHQQIADAVNAHLKDVYQKFHSNPDIKALSSHSKRFLAHMSAALEWHNLQKKGEGAHHQFAGKVEGPELQGNYEDSKYRGHSTPSATDRTKFRTQAITKQGGSRWHPGLPELTSLEESVGHKSAGKMKELYPFREIKVNGEALQPHAFSDEAPPPQIHAQDYATNLTKEHQVIAPGQESPTQAMGGYHGTKSAANNAQDMERVGLFKKSAEPNICSYFPSVTNVHYVLAKNLLPVLNPFCDMDDESFGDYVIASMANLEANPSSCAAIIAEAESRLEKAQKDEKSKRLATPARDWRKGVEDVLSGKVSPLPLTEASKRTAKEGEKRSEVEGLGYSKDQQRKRSPYAVPKEVFTDDTYTKIDPEKYKEYVNGDMSEQDLRNEHATYSEVVRHNPEAQKRHNDYIQMERESSRAGLKHAGQGVDEVETPHMDHKAVLAQAGKDLQSGKITPQEFANISAQSAKKKAESTTRKAAASELSPEEKAVVEKDPSYRPVKPGAAAKQAAESEKELTGMAQGKGIHSENQDKPEDQADNETDYTSAPDETPDYSAAQAKELTQRRDESEDKPSASIETIKSPMDMINQHPGFANYLKFKDHMLSHYKTPAVRKYMEDMINKHENDPNMDPNKLAAIYHVLHRAREAAVRETEGQKKMLGDVVKPGEASTATEGEEAGKPVSNVKQMMTPEQQSRFEEIKATKEPKVAPPPKMSEVPAPTSEKAPEAPKEDAKPVVRRRPAAKAP